MAIPFTDCSSVKCTQEHILIRAPEEEKEVVPQKKRQKWKKKSAKGATLCRENSIRKSSQRENIYTVNTYALIKQDPTQWRTTIRIVKEINETTTGSSFSRHITIYLPSVTQMKMRRLYI